MLAQSPVSWWVETLTATFLWWQRLDIMQVAHTIPKLPIERPGLALGGIGNKMKEWQGALILSEVRKSVDLCLDHLERKPVVL